MSSAIRILHISYQVPRLLQSVAIEDAQPVRPLEIVRIRKNKVATSNLRQQCVT